MAAKVLGPQRCPKLRLEDLPEGDLQPVEQPVLAPVCRTGCNAGVPRRRNGGFSIQSLRPRITPERDGNSTGGRDPGRLSPTPG